MIAQYTYLGVMAVHVVSILWVAFLFLYSLKTHERGNYKYHRKLIVYYSIFLLISLAIKISLGMGDNLFSYNVGWPFI